MIYPTKEDVDKSFTEGTVLEIDFKEECITCGFKEYWWILITKIPEMVSFCIKCSEKYSDEKQYEWKEGFWTLYEIWNWFISDENKNGMV